MKTLLLPCLIGLIAIIFAFISSTNDMNIDRMIFYEAGLRISLGQTLYKDFYIPQGFIAAYLVAPFFLFFRTGGLAIIFASILLNLTMSVLMWFFLRTVIRSKLYSFIGSVLTSVWFLPPFGSYYCDYVSYLFCFMGLFFYQKFQRNFLAIILSMFFMAISFHSKQSIGLIGFLSFIIIDPIIYRFSSYRTLSFITLFTFFVFFLLLPIFFFTDINGYIESSIINPINYFKFSADKNPLRVFLFLLFPWGIDPIKMILEKGLGRISFYPIVLMAYFTYYVIWFSTLNKRYAFSYLFFLLSTLSISALTGRLYSHMFLGFGGVIAITLMVMRKKLKKWIIPIITLVLLSGIVNIFHETEVFKEKDQYYSSTDFWPIKIKKSEHSEASAKIINYIRSKKAPIALIGSEIFLIGTALRYEIINPPLYYQPYLTIPLEKERLLLWQDKLIDAIKKNNVEYVVINSKSKIWRPLFKLCEFLNREYRVVLKVRPFFKLMQRIKP